MITLALAKGRLSEQSAELFEKAGMDIGFLDAGDRRLVFDTPDGAFRVLLVKPSDVPTYVDYGVADIGVAGKDTLMEENRPLYEMLDLGFGACRLCIAGPRERCAAPRGRPLRVATKYPNIARSFYETRGETIEVIRLNGSVELGPLVGLSDVIMDIVESGGTLRANGLEVYEEICGVSARLVVNRVSLKTHGREIKVFIDKLRMES